MPFQISYSTRQQTFSPVVLVTAGEDQLHICSPTLQLEGVVIGNLAGHTVEWEQTDGTPVTIHNPNSIVTGFDQVDDTDKSFRLYIDRGLPIEQFDDVTILKTPTSYSDGAFNNDQQYLKFEIDPQPVESDDITAFVSVVMPPPTNVQGEELGASIVVEVTWEHPINTIYQQYIAQYKVVENTLVVDDIPDVPISTAGDGLGLPTETKFYAGTFADYRIDTYYNIAGVEYVRESETKNFSALTVPLVKGYNDNAGLQAFNPDQQHFERTNFSNIVLNPDSMGNGSLRMGNNYFSKVNYSNIVINEESMGNGAFNPDAQSINITRYDPSGVGSG